MTKQLRIANDFSLPLESITQTFAILAKRRVGKTYTASVMAEEFVAHNLPFAVLDPTGAWWGLRSSADGKSEGLPVTIIGGAHGDVPLEPTAGRVIADLVAEQPGFYVIDLSQTNSNAEQDKFACDFAERLYRKKEAHRSPLMLFVDEADAFIPQRPLPDQHRMLGAFEALVRRGGIRGIGITLITQRPAVVNKNVLTQTEVLILLQMTAPQDQDAIEDWVRRNATEEERKNVMRTMASLQKGDAWIWSPAWLRLCKLAHIRERNTFNSSATPEVGAKVLLPQKMATVDLEKLSAEIKGTIERAKANDPAELRREIAALKKELKEAQGKTKEIRLEVVHEHQIKALQELLSSYQFTTDSFIKALSKVTPQKTQSVVRVDQIVRIDRTKPPAHFRLQPKHELAPADSSVSGGLKRMMIALAQRPGLNKRQLGVRAGLSSTSGTFSNYMSKLRQNAWINGHNEFQLTDDGIKALGNYEPLPEGEALFQYWMNHLGSSGAARMLKALYDHYPSAVSDEWLGSQAGISHKSGTFSNYLSQLRTLELVQGKRDALSATPEFFE